MSETAATPFGDRELRAARWYALALRDRQRASDAAAGDPEAAVFFYQQAAEKALKAVLVRADQAFGRTHSLDRLLVLAGRLDPAFLRCPGDPERVSAYATRFRYPAEDGDDSAHEEDVAAARTVADWLVTAAGEGLAGPVADLAGRMAADRRRGGPS
jgi:HEPN domain-containing protein